MSFFTPKTEQDLAALRAKHADLVLMFDALAHEYDELVAFIKNAPVSSGICCCGEDMERHSDPFSAGHSPVDQWDHTVSSIPSAQDVWEAAIRKARENPAKPL